VEPGQVYAEANPAPGFTAERYEVVRPSDRPGWWVCLRIRTARLRRIPERALLNPDVYRLTGVTRDDLDRGQQLAQQHGWD
jgi:hypothetical protein